MRRVLLLLAVLLLARSPALFAQSMGATEIVQGGNAANVTANNNLQVELHNGATTIGVTGTSLNVNITNTDTDVNVAQINGNTTSTAASGTQLVGISDGSGTKYVADPCNENALTSVAINEATSSLTTVITGTSAKKTYICSINLVTATAQNINFVAGTGTNCATTVHVGFFGGTTAATGWNFAANGGIAISGGGYHVAGGTDTAADNICYTSSSTGQVSGTITYVQQ